MGVHGSRPEDCQSSQEAGEIADRLFQMGETESSGNDCAETSWGSQFAAAGYYKEAAKWYKRRDELKAQGK